MTTDFNKEHALETYKSLIQISVSGMKLLAVLNGGAAVALLAYLGNLSGNKESVPDMRLPMGCFIGGLVLCGLTMIFSYTTQLRLYNESMGRSSKCIFTSHSVWLNLAFITAFLSIVAFSLGALVAVFKFQ